MSDYRWISPGRPGACTVHAHQRMPGAAPTLVLLSASPHSVIEPRAAPLLNAPRDSLSVRHAWHCRSPAVPSHLLCLPAALCPVTGMPGPSQHSTWGLKSSNPPPLSSLSRSFRRHKRAVPAADGRFPRRAPSAALQLWELPLSRSTPLLPWGRNLAPLADVAVSEPASPHRVVAFRTGPHKWNGPGLKLSAMPALDACRNRASGA